MSEENQRYEFIEDEDQPLIPTVNPILLDGMPTVGNDSGNSMLAYLWDAHIEMSSLAFYTLTLRKEYHEEVKERQYERLQEHIALVCSKYECQYYVRYELTIRGNVHAHAIISEPYNRSDFRKELKQYGFICVRPIFNLPGLLEYMNKGAYKPK